MTGPGEFRYNFFSFLISFLQIRIERSDGKKRKHPDKN